MSKRILLEICCGSVDDALVAQKAGADRIELNSALFLGGLTPSYGTILEVRAQLNIPIMVMIRPREGGFCYSEGEIATMERDIVASLEAGADGVVFGILHEDGKINRKHCRRLIKLVDNKKAVFHKAFDVTPNPFDSLEELIDIGFNRILTSGQRKTAYDGVRLLNEIVVKADKRIEILPGGGIKPLNVKNIIEKTGCEQVHMGGFKNTIDNSAMNGAELHFGSPIVAENTYQIVDAALVRELKSILENL